jgi:hypothetical protein
MADPVVPLDINEYLREQVLEVDETFELREGSAFVDFFIKPLVVVLQPIRNEIEVIRELQSLVNAVDMDDEELDSLIANIFLARRSGSNSSGTVRLFFSEAQNVSVSQGTGFLSTGGLRFTADEDTLITASAMAVNVDGGSFYLDVPATAEAPGDQYNIAAGNIVSVEVQIAGVIRVTNFNPFTGGLATETNEEFVARAQTAVTVRNLVNDRSIVTTLLDEFPNVKAVVPIGFNDPEMERASLTVVLPGPPQHVVTIPDRGGHADIYIEGDGFVSRTTTVQSAPGIISTNNERGTITILDYGFRRIAVQGGYFNGLYYPGDGVVDLLPSRRYTVSLQLAPSGREWQLNLIDVATTDPYPAVPGGEIPLANLETNNATVISLVDIREDLFSFDRPVMVLDSAELLDPTSLQPTGVTLRNGEAAQVSASIASDPGQAPHAVRSPSNGDLHLVFLREDGVYYQRHDSNANIVVDATQISTELYARNLRVSANSQDNLNVFFLNFDGDVRFLQIDTSGANVIPEADLVDSGVSGVTTQFDVQADPTGAMDMLLINENLGQPDVYYLRMDRDGAVTTALATIQTNGSNASDPSISGAPTFRTLSNGTDGTNQRTGSGGVTNGTDVFTDAGATFLTDGLVPGDQFILISGDTLPTAEQDVYTVLTVDGETQVTFSGGPTITASTNVTYQVLVSLGDRCGCWVDDQSTSRQVRTITFDTAGAVAWSGRHLVLSDPTVVVDNVSPVVVRSALSDRYFFSWIHNGVEIQRLSLSGFASVTTSATGDTQGTLLSKSFFDASNPFGPTDVGKYLYISAGSGLGAEDFRAYEIEEFVTAGQVLLAEPVTDSTAADIEYVIIDQPQLRDELIPTFFLSPITSMDVAIDNTDRLHYGLIETEGNAAKVYLGKFDDFFRPLLRPGFVRVSSSANNRSSISVSIDEIRQPYLVWDDFSASASTVQLAKYQAQEYSYFVNDSGLSFSVKEDASIILDPTLEGQAIRFTYRTSERVPEVESYATGSVNRIVIGNYCVRHTLPAFTDVSITYGGANAPTEDEAITLLTDFINAIGSTAEAPSVNDVVTQSTLGDELEKADLLDVLYDAGADSARVISDMVVDETQTDGTVRTRRSIDLIIITRTARFEARTISVTKE